MMASEHRWIYLGAIVVLAAMIVIGLLTFTEHKHTAEANDKAQQLAANLSAAGYRVPSQAQIVGTLGTNGGAACAHPNDALVRGAWLDNLSNGAAGPGQRPVISDRRALHAQVIVMQVYCPNQVPAFVQKLNDLKTSTTVRT
jgi:hypothetical protein